MPIVTLQPLKADDREQFIKDNQYAFKYGAMEEFGLRDDHFEEDGEIISRETIEQSIDSGEAYRIGGAVISVDGNHGDLELLFTDPFSHSKGIGYAAWCEIKTFIQRLLSGKQSPLTSRLEIFTFMSTAVDFTS